MKIFLSFLFSVVFSYSLFSQKEDVSVDLAVTCEYSELNLDSNDFSSFAIFDTLLPQKSIFFIGEDHSYRRSNTRLQIQLLKYLHQKAGVRTLLFEFGPSIGWMVNHYLQTGDSSYYHSFRNYAFVDFQKFYEHLREFNETLDSANKINVVGIDMERSLASATKYMNLLLPKNKEIPTEIQMNVESLIGLGAYLDKYFDEYQRDSLFDGRGKFGKNSQYFSTQNTLDIFLDDFKKNDSVYKIYLGKDYGVFKTVIDGVLANKQWEEYQGKTAYQEWVYREQYMFSRFEDLVKKNPGQKYFGSFGRCHTSLNEQSEWCGLYYFKSLLKRINSSSNPALKNQVLSVGTYYPKSATSINNPTTESAYLDELIEFSKDDAIVVYKVFCDTTFNNDMKQKFQYVIVNKLDPDKESRESEITAGFDDFTDDEEEVRYHFDVNYGALSGNFLNLNNYIQTHLDPSIKFDNYIPMFGIGTMGSGDHFAYSIDYRMYVKQSKTLVNGDVLDLDGYSVQFLMGRDFFESKIFDCIAMGGLGYGKFKLKQNIASQNGSGLFGTTLISAYENQAFNGVLQVDTRVNIKFVSVGFKAGYQFDFSNPNWRTENIVANTPGTKMSGWFGMVNLSYFTNLGGEKKVDEDFEF
ncbi:MAG: erythromycin esterase family protein [Bacteroidetes bacterium]|nr:erythromycin esterase family protein [Bacteroidota bacterium]